MAEEFEEGFLIRIEKSRKDDPEHWSMLFTYAEMLAAREKKQAKKDNPLNIDLKDISIYGDMPLNVLPIDEKVLIRNEGSMKTKKRTRSIMVFNAEKYPEIHMRLECNARVLNNDISADDASYVRDGKSLIFCFERDGVSFHKIEVKDDVNNITYVFKLCIIDVSFEYLSSIKRNFVIDYKKTKKNCKVKLVGIGTDLVFNSNGATNVSEKLNDNTEYKCKYDERLHLYTTEEELSDFGSGIYIEINFSGIVLPLILFPDEVKSVEMIGRKILREKFSMEKSFEIEEDGDHFYRGSQEYHAKTNLLKELRIEKKIVNERILYGKCKHIHGTDDLEIDAKELALPLTLKQSYYDLLQAYKKCNTIPTLAYLSGELKDAAENYLKEFNLLYATLKEGSNLSPEQENGMLLGTLFVGRNDEELLFTPFHPLNIAYQLQLCEETKFENASDIVIDRLNSIYLLPYTKHNKKIYKVSDQMYSMEWKYYAPVENRKYRGSRRYVPKLIEEKITEFVSHFKYIFSDINNKTIRVNLINMGDCSDVFNGIAQYYIHAIGKTPDVDQLMKFKLHIYSDGKKTNVFENIKEYSRLKSYLTASKLSFANGVAMNSLEGFYLKILSVTSTRILESNMNMPIYHFMKWSQKSHQSPLQWIKLKQVFP